MFVLIRAVFVGFLRGHDSPPPRTAPKWSHASRNVAARLYCALCLAPLRRVLGVFAAAGLFCRVCRSHCTAGPATAAASVLLLVVVIDVTAAPTVRRPQHARIALDATAARRRVLGRRSSVTPVVCSPAIVVVFVGTVADATRRACLPVPSALRCCLSARLAVAAAVVIVVPWHGA